MTTRHIVCIQLSELWGDEFDTLNHDGPFVAGALEYVDSSDATLVMPSAFRAARVARNIDDSRPLCIITYEGFHLNESKADEVVVDCREARGEALAELHRQLRNLGYRGAGRAWGEAGQTRRYILARDLNQHANALLEEARIRAGALTVHIRDRWMARDQIKARFEKVRSRMRPYARSLDVLDEEFGAPLPAVLRIDARDIFPSGMHLAAQPWSISSFADEPESIAASCFDQHGIWPISFSFPGQPLPLVDHPEELVAPIIPGLPYSFTDEQSYREAYWKAYLGLTHRKAGWDCFRHVEILGAGAVPLMPDADDIPEYSMVHYPKRAMVETIREVAISGSPPGRRVREGFRTWLGRHLTSRAMATYILKRSSLDQDSKVLFVDERVPHTVDYLSVLTYIGLKQILGTRCEALYPIDYVFQDSNRDESALYGRGFGYSRVLPDHLRTSWERVESSAPRPALNSYDAIVIGSISRNASLARTFLDEIPRSQTIWIHGEDTPPSVREVSELRATGARLFVRAIHTSCRGRV